LQLEVFKLNLLLIVDKHENPNAVYQSEGDPIFTIFSCSRILQWSYWSIRQHGVLNFIWSSLSLPKSQYICSQCLRGWRIWVNKEEIQYRQRTVKVQWKFSGKHIDSSSAQCHICKIYIGLEATCNPPRHREWPHLCIQLLWDAATPPWSHRKCSQTLQEQSQVLLPSPAVMEVHSECYEIWLME
jgi:hypothetical protein